jgi:hypothetical protein
LAPAAEDEDQMIARAYGEFMEARAKCGQEGLEFGKVREALKQQLQAIRERTGCERVQLRVRVVDGKAKVRAVPEG